MFISIEDTNELTALDKAVLSILVGDNAVVPVPAATPAKATPTPAKKAAAAAPAKADPEPEADAGSDDAVTMQDAVDLATRLVSEGKAADVKAALANAGVKRVSELEGDAVGVFVTTLS